MLTVFRLPKGLKPLLELSARKVSINVSLRGDYITSEALLVNLQGVEVPRPLDFAGARLEENVGSTAACGMMNWARVGCPDIVASLTRF